MNVKNRACIRRLSLKALLASRKRNLIAVAAIALTALLFTSLFTIGMSLNEGFQQSNFRQVGGSQHGGFKYLTEEQFLILREDPLIKQWSLRRFLGMPMEEPFHKSHVEISYADKNWAHWGFCDPIEGRLPQEGTQEAATDLRVLELLGVEPELGAPFTVTFDVDGKTTTQTFTLCGWWEYDTLVTANHILIPESRVNAILEEVGVDPASAADGITGTWNLDVMLGSSLHIESDLLKILERNGYQEGHRDGEISIGVNWGYSGAQLFESIDAGTILAIASALALIVFTGYLIIYNIFSISVTGDIRFYGLLKTIGTTPRQLRRIIRHQALALSLCGIPIGLVLGWMVGSLLTPVVVRELNGIISVTSGSPVIFVGAAVFSLVTVFLSCGKPGRIAAKVSPVEAVRYTESSTGKRTRKTSAGKVSPASMAWANLGRNPGKTALTIISLCLAVVILNITVTFTSGFDMDKYLQDVPVDFMVANATYFQAGIYPKQYGLPQELIDEINSMEGVVDGGKTYAITTPRLEFVTEDAFRKQKSHWDDEETVNQMVENAERNEDGLLGNSVQLCGMEPAVLNRMNVLDGDLSKVMEPGSNYIAAVCEVDDYGKPYWDSLWARVGDQVTIRYMDEYEFFNTVTGEVYPEDVNLELVDLDTLDGRAKSYRDVTYTVAALVDQPNMLSYRYYGDDEFLLNDETFRRDTGTDTLLYYAFDMADRESTQTMETFLQNYTENTMEDYESKKTYEDGFESFRSMFLLLGGALSLIIGLIGILNFFNTVMTGIFSRQREFAVLQAVGMTGRQLKTMLILEGIFYALSAGILALLLSLVMNPLVGRVLESTFWFFTAKFNILPVLLVLPVFLVLGWAVPVIMYHRAVAQSVVQRLRASET